MKKVSFILLSILIMCCMGNIVSAGELNANEKSIIETISKDEFPKKIEQRYLNQLENYFCTDDVQICRNLRKELISVLGLFIMNIP